MSTTNTDHFVFAGFDPPHYTQVPDDFFDALMTELIEAELRVLLYIIRHTFGYKKNADAISFNQFLRGITKKNGEVVDKGSGLKSPTHLSNALKSLEEKGIIEVHRSQDRHMNKQTTIYALRFRQGVLPDGYHPTTRSVVGVLPEAYIQETTIQERTKQYSNNSKDARPENHREPAPEVAMDQIVARQQYLSTERPASTQGVPTNKRTPRPRSSRTKLPCTDYLDTVIRAVSAELHDESHGGPNLAQAKNLLTQTGLAEQVFVELVYEARSITKRQGNIRKTNGNGQRNRMPYFFRVLRDLLAVDEEPTPLLLTEEELQQALDVRPLHHSDQGA